jgi:uncharacterized protein (TIGR02284 family)
MENKNDETVSALNKLVEINNDRIDGYEKAVNETNESDLKAKFSQFASQSRQYRSQLEGLVTEHGGKAVEGTTVSGKFYRAWMDIKAALSGKDRKAIIGSCEYGEDVAKETYEKVLEDNADLPERVRNIIRQQYDGIKEAHDSVKQMREALAH